MYYGVRPADLLVNQVWGWGKEVVGFEQLSGWWWHLLRGKDWVNSPRLGDYAVETELGGMGWWRFSSRHVEFETYQICTWMSSKQLDKHLVPAEMSRVGPSFCVTILLAFHEEDKKDLSFCNKGIEIWAPVSLLRSEWLGPWCSIPPDSCMQADGVVFGDSKGKASVGTQCTLASFPSLFLPL